VDVACQLIVRKATGHAESRIIRMTEGATAQKSDGTIHETASRSRAVANADKSIEIGRLRNVSAGALRSAENGERIALSDAMCSGAEALAVPIGVPLRDA